MYYSLNFQINMTKTSRAVVVFRVETLAQNIPSQSLPQGGRVLGLRCHLHSVPVSTITLVCSLQVRRSFSSQLLGLESMNEPVRR